MIPTKYLISGLFLGLKNHQWLTLPPSSCLLALKEAIIPQLYPATAQMDKDNLGWQIFSSSETIKRKKKKKEKKKEIGLAGTRSLDLKVVFAAEHRCLSFLFLAACHPQDDSAVAT